MPVTIFGRMDRHFCRRQGEDQPSVASVHGIKSEDVPQESAVSRRIFTIHNDMPMEMPVPIGFIISAARKSLFLIGKSEILIGKSLFPIVSIGVVVEIAKPSASSRNRFLIRYTLPRS